MSSRFYTAALLSVALFAASGCGGNEFDTAPVRGVVTCGGQPLTSGVITFMPIAPERGGTPGKAASGKIGPDGSFVLTTYEHGDGAIVGKHKVAYAPATEGEDEEEEGDGDAAVAPPARPAPARGRGKVPCRFGGQAEAEVLDTDNELKIELSDFTPGQDEGDDD